MNVGIQACKCHFLKTARNALGLWEINRNASVGALKRPEKQYRGLETGVSRREVGYVRFVAG